MKNQATRRPRWALLLIQKARRLRTAGATVAADVMPRDLPDVLIFLGCSALSLGCVAIAAYQAGWFG